MNTLISTSLYNFRISKIPRNLHNGLSLCGHKFRSTSLKIINANANEVDAQTVEEPPQNEELQPQSKETGTTSTPLDKDLKKVGLGNFGLVSFLLTE